MSDGPIAAMMEANGLRLKRVLERFCVSVRRGGCLTCDADSTRQRVDLTELVALPKVDPSDLLQRLLTGARRVEMGGLGSPVSDCQDPGSLPEEQGRAGSEPMVQTRLLARLRRLAWDAQDYEETTGGNALFIGFPFVSLPPGCVGTGGRILAPLGLAAVDLEVRRWHGATVTLAAKEDRADLVLPNLPLLVLLEQEAGLETADLLADAEGLQPWRGINEIARRIGARLSLDRWDAFGPGIRLVALPGVAGLPAKPVFLSAAVLGLFPVSTSGVLRDLRAMAGEPELSGLVRLFLASTAEAPGGDLAASGSSPGSGAVPRTRERARDRFVLPADPCQAKAVRLAGEGPVLVIQGPPGTGKSQTLTNIAADHLSRGERVLVVSQNRAALDVVRSRLEKVGLGDLCAVVHDPQRDQSPLYLRLLAYLEALPRRTLEPEVGRELQEADAELRQLDLELRGWASALAELPGSATGPERGCGSGAAFSDLVGQWLSLETGRVIQPEQVKGADLDQLASAEPSIVDILDRALKVGYPSNPWARAAGFEPGDVPAWTQVLLRERLEQLGAEAAALDATCDPAVPPLAEGEPLPAQAEAREQLAGLLREYEQAGSAQARIECFGRSPDDVRRVLDNLKALEPQLALIQGAPLERELVSAGSSLPPSLAELDRSLAVLDRYGAVADRWYAFVFLGRKSSARQVLAPYRLTLSPAMASRFRSHLEGLKARRLCQDFLVRELGGSAPATGLLPDADLVGAVRERGARLQVVGRLRQNPALSSIGVQVAEALGGSLSRLAERLDASAERARRVQDLLTRLAASGLFAPGWLEQLGRRLHNNQSVGPEFQELLATSGTLEDVLRVRRAEARLPGALRGVIAVLIGQGTGGLEGLTALRKALLSQEISRRVRETPRLRELDSARLEDLFRCHAELQEQKFRLCAKTILNLWLEVQRLRLAGNGDQLNHAGINLKRRLVARGSRSPGLRQVILHGSRSQESDPLFDLCPVWMASPATIAHIFPRQPDFDIVLFDEASQCQLAEAMPVLTRGCRVVVAGDPQQLPPIQIFEAAEAEPGRDPVEGEPSRSGPREAAAEDLLAAAFHAPIPRCRLNVHYRSRDETLVAFSNRHFYENRLQPVPAHPSRRAVAPPLRLIRAEGICDSRGNLKEAEWVVRIVRELLQSPDPPSLGVACLSLPQRDLILDKLEEAASADAGFAHRYTHARQRRGPESFEGLFVRTLGNLQGEERDHIIISTTFGPDANGGVPREFGPLGQPGGARCLNVLVTRARRMIHLLTSIPRAEYAAMPDMALEEGPGGRWLLCAYLRFAERVQEEFGVEPCPASSGPGPGTGLVKIHSRRGGSPVALALAGRLARVHGRHCEVHWGNDGFCVDVVLKNSCQPGDVALGLLCDVSRFQGAEDAVEWDLFRTAMLKAQGWKLRRVWSPALFPDPVRIEAGLWGAL